MPDFPRLAEAIQARTTALGWRQRDLLPRTTLSRETIQSLWRGDRTYAPNRATQRALEQLLGWSDGSVKTVLAGGEPTVIQAEQERPPPEERTALPLRIQMALEDGRPLEYDVLEFEVGGMPFSFIAIAQTGAYDTEQQRDALREQLDVYRRMIEHVRREGETAGEDTQVDGENL